MDNLNFIVTLGTLRVYCFIHGHGNRMIGSFSHVSLEDVSRLVNDCVSDYLERTRLSHCKKVFSYKFEC